MGFIMETLEEVEKFIQSQPETIEGKRLLSKIDRILKQYKKGAD